MSTTGERVYTLGYSPTATQMMAARTARTSATFFLPHLRTGMHVLDCGCGPGSITLGIAEVVSPGTVVGVDIEASQIEQARAHATARGISNVSFHACDVRHLPFADASFDAVFGHAILMQFTDPVPVLKQVQRVLKPGGVIAFREPAFDGNLYEPPSGARQEYLALFMRVLEHNGANPRIGQRLGALLHRAGFARVTMSASYEATETPEAKRLAYEQYARLCDGATWVEQAIGLGWLSTEARGRLSAALRAEGMSPEAFSAVAYGEVVGWKGDGSTV
jgi:ubiquinone/menaquinone biosynthesis C-methylase UbiE